MKYDIGWMLAVLEDLQEFCEENQMPTSKLAVLQAKAVAQKEALELELDKTFKTKGESPSQNN